MDWDSTNPFARGLPEVSLKAARGKRDEARKQLAADIDPGSIRRTEKLTKLESKENSFEGIVKLTDLRA